MFIRSGLCLDSRTGVLGLRSLRSRLVDLHLLPESRTLMPLGHREVTSLLGRGLLLVKRRFSACVQLIIPDTRRLRLTGTESGRTCAVVVSVLATSVRASRLRASVLLRDGILDPCLLILFSRVVCLQEDSNCRLLTIALVLLLSPAQEVRWIR